MNIGIRAHDVENTTIKDLATRLDDYGLHSVQFALQKSIKEFEIKSTSLNTGLAKYVNHNLREGNVDIAVLGCYINMIHPDLAERKKVIDYFKAHLRFARDFGCSIVGSETGGVYPDIIYTEDNYTEEAFLEVVNSVKELVEEAEKFGVMVGIEGGVNHPIYSPELMKRLIDQVKSNNLQVIFDPVNYLTTENHEQQHQVIDQAFEYFGERIVIIHAKDYQIKDNEAVFVPVGTGLLDYEYLVRKIDAEKPMIPVLLEETQAPHIENAIQHIKKYK